MVLADMHLQTVLVLVFLATKLAANSLGDHMLAYDMLHQVSPLGRCFPAAKAQIRKAVILVKYPHLAQA